MPRRVARVEARSRVLDKPIEKISVILVHGIGEQRRFEHLESECRKIVNSIFARYGRRRRDVTITLQTGNADSFLGQQSNWRAALLGIGAVLVPRLIIAKVMRRTKLLRKYDCGRYAHERAK
jgi:hypothetical protein